MAQIFPPGANSIGRLLFWGAVPLALFAWFIGSQLYTSSYVDETGVTVLQPVPFSHRHHAGELGIDCLYCHPHAEKGPVAGVPPSRTCMTCHSQIWKDAPMLEPVRESFATGLPIAWHRATVLPDYVYFDHSIHVARGVKCQACHGEVQDMPLVYKAVAFRMKDCLACHENKEMVARAETPRLAVEQYLATLPGARGASHAAVERLAVERGVRKARDCSTCHR